ncbi:autophagy protein 5-like [Paramacrobiotus metropolitanus]|uniref:autophagy protein 5-like n=1 Tax=Paramacrobiotus metropolitanus TaxID=2943436 RepID=UPI0024464938|nr:autophagy protein 5-like [Paramacrobiotus metropolitanus]XP_055349370.1 autophagy protein 5-like [Paramacrobiotus metropolitanus]
MAEDKEILRELWNGQIPVQFVLSSDEITALASEAPQPFFALVPRQTYFPLALDKVNRHFLKYISQAAGQEMWLECDGAPLRHHYPVGVLFDLYGDETRLPWTLTVHYSNFPESELVHLNSREAIEAFFMATLKEADVLKHRNAVITNMQKKDHKNLWTGLSNDRFDLFWSVNKKLMETSIEMPHFRNIPFRLYQPDKSFLQKLIKPVDEEDHRLTTLDDLLHQTLTNINVSSAVVLIQGIEVPRETPLQWLSEHMSYPDNFLHICVHSA